MLEPLKLSAASTALVCLATIALAPTGQGWAVPVTMNNAANGSAQLKHQQQQVATPTNTYQWSTFGLLPSGVGQTNVQRLNPVPVASNPIQAAALTSERIRRQTANKKKKPAKKNAKALIAECLAAHNKMRRLHKVPELQWDDKLAAFAQKRSDHIAASDGKEFGHPPDLPFGENLFWHSSLDKGCEYMVKGWYDEIDLYNFKAPTFAPATGHFTQMIWRGTSKVGCAFTPSSGPRGGLYLTCNYDPPGNWVGEFEENVPLPAVEKPASGARELAPPRPPSTTARPATTTSTTTTTTTVKPSSAVSTQTVTPVADKQAETTKPKSKKKKKKKKKSDEKKDDKDKKKKKGNKKKKRKGGKKKKTGAGEASTSTKPPVSSNTTAGSTTEAPRLISS